MLERLGVLERFGDVIARVGGTAPFEKGLFASTEMLVDGFMHLIDAGIVKRKVYDWEPLQRLLDAGQIDERVSERTLNALVKAGAIPKELDAASTRAARALRHPQSPTDRSAKPCSTARTFTPASSSAHRCSIAGCASCPTPDAERSRCARSAASTTSMAMKR